MPRFTLRLLPLTLAGALLLLASAAAAQRSELTLQVVDMNGQAVGPVSVTVTSPTGEVTQTKTRKNGKLEMRLPAADEPYALLLQREGYPDREVQVVIKEGVPAMLEAQLWDEATVTKQEAVDAFNEGVRTIQAGDAEAALPLFRKAAALDPTIAAAHRMIAAILHGMGKPAEALEPLNKALEFGELPPEFVGMTYDIFHAAGDPRVEDAKRQAVAAGRGDEIAPAVFAQAVAAAREGDEDRAIEMFTEAATLAPKLHMAQRNIGTIHFNNQNWEPALEALERTLELDPRNDEALRMRYFSYAAQGMLEESIAAGKAWLEIDPAAGAQAMRAANQLFEAEEFGNAKLHYQSVIAWDQNQPMAWFQLGMLSIRNADSAAARRHLEKFLEMAPEHADAETAREALGRL